MENTLNILSQIIDIINEMSPYLLLGFLLAGLMHAFIPSNVYSRYLAAGSFKSVLYAALFGVPLPLCSCGVIPTAMSLRKEGASKGATISFLTATPQTGVDSIFATYSLMGLPFAIVRPIAALCTALFGGQLVNIVEKGEGGQNCRVSSKNIEHSLEAETTSLQKLRSAISYAFLEMMEDIGKWLVVGLVVAGLISVLVPDSFFAIFKDNTLLSMLLVLAISVPMYICATGSIPIAVALMMKGLTPGAALVMLMAGPACNVASMLVINKVLGRKTLLTYLFSIIAGSIAFGIAIDHLLPKEWFIPTMMGSACCHEESASWFNVGCTVLLFILLLNAICHHYHHPHCHSHEVETRGCTCSYEDTEGEGKKVCETKTSRLTFKIKGMNCNHCRANAQKALNSIPGTIAAEVTLSTSEAWVEGEVTMEQVKEALESLGFTVID